MPLRRLRPEALLEAFEKGMRQRDFRQQDEHLEILLQRRRHRLEIDLRLARPGNAVDQRDRRAAGKRRLPQHQGDALLVGRQVRRRKARLRSCDDRARRDHHRLEHALRPQPVDHRRRHAGGMGKARPRPGEAVVRCVDHPAARRRHAVRFAARPLQPLRPGFRVEGRRRAQEHLRHHAGRRQRVGRHPVDEAAHVAVDRRTVEHLRDRPELLGIDGVRRAVPYHARHLARPERHPDDRPRHHCHAVGNGICIGSRRRHRHQHGGGFRVWRIVSHGT